MVIIVIGMQTDPVIQYFGRFIKAQAIRDSIVFLDQQCFASTIHVDNRAWHIDGLPAIDHHKVQGVWNRLLSEHIQYKHPVIENMHIYARYLMNHCYTKVLNKPAAGMSNFSKPYQLQLINPRYINKPNELITNHYNLSAASHKRVVKSVSSVRSIVTLYKQAELVSLEPVLLQEYLAGINIRVHVIGCVYVATLIKATAVDYRYAKVKTKKEVYLPGHIARECIEIAQQLDLPFAGIDLIYLHKKFWLLEVNPAPGYHYFETRCKKITRLILKYWQK